MAVTTQVSSAAVTPDHETAHSSAFMTMSARMPLPPQRLQLRVHPRLRVRDRRVDQLAKLLERFGCRAAGSRRRSTGTLRH